MNLDLDAAISFIDVMPDPLKQCCNSIVNTNGDAGRNRSRPRTKQFAEGRAYGMSVSIPQRAFKSGLNEGLARKSAQPFEKTRGITRALMK